MVNLPAFVSVPTFGSAASKTQPDPSTYVGGYIPGEVFPAEHENWFMAGLTANGVAGNAALYATVEELDNYLTAVGVTPASGTTTQIGTAINSPVGLGISAMGMTVDYTDWYQLDRHIIARSHLVGETFASEIVEAQVIVSASRSSANPTYPDYNPVISRNADKVITSAMAPLLVTKLRGYAVLVMGVSTFTGTVSGSTITFTLSTTITAMLTMLLNEALVRRWFSSNQSANFAVSGGDFTGMTVTVAGTEYAIASVNIAAGQISVTGSPITGVQTCSLYPYRIVGSSTSIQLPRLSGFVMVGENDSDGAEINGYRHMDELQSHWHDVIDSNSQPLPAILGGNQGSGAVIKVFDVSGSVSATTMISDGSHGAPRSGKTTNPRSAAKTYFTWAGDLRATA